MTSNAREWMDSMSNLSVGKEPVQVLMHFTSAVTEKQHDELQANGVLLYDYVPDNSYYALVQFPLNLENVNSLPIHSVINVRPEWKADEIIWEQVNGRSGAVKTLVSFTLNSLVP